MRRALLVITVAVSMIASVAAFTGSGSTSTKYIRVSGNDRYETAAKVATSTFSPGVARAYLATGEQFADALAAASAAGRFQAPVLLTGATFLPSATAAALRALAPKEIIVVGADAAVSPAVLDAAASYAQGAIRRVAGSNRYETAAALADDAYGDRVGGVVVLTSGEGFADALGAAAAAAAGRNPLLLSRYDTVPPATDFELRRIRPERIVLVGGPAVLSTSVELALAAYAERVDRWHGDHRAATAVAVANNAFGPRPVAYLATGQNFPDALAGAAAAGLRRAPIVLTNGDCVDAATADYLGNADEVYVLGGQKVVSAKAGSGGRCEPETATTVPNEDGTTSTPTTDTTLTPSPETTTTTSVVSTTTTSTTSTTTAPQPVLTGLFAAVNGAPGNDGTKDRPLDLATALGGASPARPGDTVWVRGGTYRGCYHVKLTGTSVAPVVVRAHPGERVVIDGNGCRISNSIVLVEGAHTWLWGLEVMSSDPTRTTDQLYDGTEIRPTGVNVYGPGTKLINMLIHDAGNGVGLWSQATNAEVYGTIVYNNGWVGPDRGHGHGIYSQNQTGVKRVTDVMSFNNFATGMKAYATNGFASHFRFTGVISANNGSAALPAGSSQRMPNILVGTEKNTVQDIVVADSALYQPSGTSGGGLGLGIVGGNSGLTVTNNWVAGGASGLGVSGWDSGTVRGNTIHVTSPTNSNSNAVLAKMTSFNGTKLDWNSNTYFDESPVRDGSNRYAFGYDKATNSHGGGWLRFDEWRNASGNDGGGTYSSGPPPTHVVVRPNRYEPGRAHVAVYNLRGASSASIDLANVGLSIGQRYEVWDAQNLSAGPIHSGSHTGGAAVIQLPGTASATQPVNAPHPVSHTAPWFHTLVVVPR